MKGKHGSKMIAPIVIAVLGVAWFGCYLWVLMQPEIPLPVKAVGAAVTVGLIGTMIWMTVERIKEIRSGEEDDLSKY